MEHRKLDPTYGDTREQYERQVKIVRRLSIKNDMLPMSEAMMKKLATFSMTTT